MAHATIASVMSYKQFRDISRSQGSTYEERLVASRHMKKFVLLQAIFGGLSVLAGITTIFMASANLHFPFAVGTDIWNGALCIASGALAYRVSYVIHHRSDLHLSLVCTFLMYGVTSFLNLVGSAVGFGLSTYAIILCARRNHPYAHTCLPRRDPNLAMAITDIVIELILLVLSAMASWQFSRYRTAFDVDLPCERPPGARTEQWRRSKWEENRKKVSEDILNGHGFLTKGPSLDSWSSFKSTRSVDVLTGPAFYQSKKACYAYYRE